jgi:hypothetical protein
MLRVGATGIEEEEEEEEEEGGGGECMFIDHAFAEIFNSSE